MIMVGSFLVIRTMGKCGARRKADKRQPSFHFTGLAATLHVKLAQRM
jgi:hypothetical protein